MIPLEVSFLRMMARINNRTKPTPPETKGKSFKEDTDEYFKDITS